MTTHHLAALVGLVLLVGLAYANQTVVSGPGHSLSNAWNEDAAIAEYERTHGGGEAGEEESDWFKRMSPRQQRLHRLRGAAETYDRDHGKARFERDRARKRAAAAESLPSPKARSRDGRKQRIDGGARTRGERGNRQP